MNTREIGLIGCGKMGRVIASRLALRKGIKVVLFDENPAAVQKLASENRLSFFPATALRETIQNLSEKPRIIWLMLPAGKPIEETLFGSINPEKEGLQNLLQEGDIIINGGNCYYKDSLRQSLKLEEKGIHYLDVGCSGGIRGLETGLCLMVGGEQIPFDACEPFFRAVAWKENGYALVGPSGAGHYLKMVHNAAEYVIMGALGESIELLNHPESPYKYNTELVLELLNKGSVIRSFLLGLAAELFKNPELIDESEGKIGSAGEWLPWTIEEAMKLKVPFNLMAMALSFRFASQQDGSYSAKIQEGLRKLFGGHSDQFWK